MSVSLRDDGTCWYLMDLVNSSLVDVEIHLL